MLENLPILATLSPCTLVKEGSRYMEAGQLLADLHGFGLEFVFYGQEEDLLHDVTSTIQDFGYDFPAVGPFFTFTEINPVTPSPQSLHSDVNAVEGFEPPLRHPQPTMEQGSSLSLHADPPMVQEYTGECGGGDFAIEEIFPELAEIKFPSLQLEDDGQVTGEVPCMQKSASYGCQDFNEQSNDSPIKHSFLDCRGQGEDLTLRRAYSEGDIETLGSGGINGVDKSGPKMERFLSMNSYWMEDRKEKLLRYRRKKTRRNFHRKIKYACRKALADKQLRVRGRFARMEDSESLNQSRSQCPCAD